MPPSFLAVLTNLKPSKLLFILLFTLLGSGRAAAQYARGDEVPLRPNAPDPNSVGRTMSLEEYTASQIVSEAAARYEPPPPPTNLPVEKLTPDDHVTIRARGGNGYSTSHPRRLPQTTLTASGNGNTGNTGNTETVIVEQAIYRCEKGNSYVFVDKDNKNKFQKCVLMRAEKTAEISLTPPEVIPQKPENACTGAIYYRGNTYVFDENEPCPIPEAILLHLLPAATQPITR